MGSDNAIITILKSPTALLYGLLVMGAFSLSVHIQGYSDFYYAPVNLFLILGGLAAFMPSFTKGIMLPSSLPAMMVLTFWSFIALSLGWSTVPYASLLMFAMFCGLPLTFFGIIMSPAREKILVTAGLALGFCLTLLAFWALWQHFVTGSEYGYRAHHPYLNPNSLAAVINMGLLPAFTFTLYSRTKTVCFLSLILTALFFAALLATESRGAICAAALSGAAVFLFSMKTPSFSWRHAGILVSILLAVILVFHFASPSPHMADRMAHTLAPNQDDSMLERFAIWTASLAMIKDHPWIGTGYGTFFLYYPPYRLAGYDNSLGFWAHMDPLQFWAEMGIAAPLLYYGILLVILIHTMKVLTLTPAESRLRPVIWASFSALLTMALHSHLTFNMYIMSLLILTGYMLAVLYIYTHKARGDGFTKAGTKFTAFLTGFVVVIFAVIIAAVSISAASGPYYLQKAERFKQGQNPKAYLQALYDAERWSPDSFIGTETELASYNISILERYDRSGIQFDRNTLIRETDFLLNEAARWNPVWPYTDHLRAKLYKQAGDSFIPDSTKEAEKAWQAALRKNPANFTVNRALAEHYISQGNVDNAYNTLIKALDYPRTRIQDTFYKARLRQMKQLLDLKQQHYQNKFLQENMGTAPTPNAESTK